MIRVVVKLLKMYHKFFVQRGNSLPYRILEDLKDWIRGYARQSAPPREVSETRELIKNLRDVVEEAEKNTALSETEVGGWGSQASDDDFPYSEDEPFWFSDSESYSA